MEESGESTARPQAIIYLAQLTDEGMKIAKNSLPDLWEDFEIAGLSELGEGSSPGSAQAGETPAEPASTEKEETTEEKPVDDTGAAEPEESGETSPESSALEKPDEAPQSEVEEAAEESASETESSDEPAAKPDSAEAP